MPVDDPMERRPLQWGTLPSTALHTEPLLISFDPESKSMTVSTLTEFFTHSIATPNDLWDLLVHYQDNPREVLSQETASYRAQKVHSAPSKAEQDQFLEAKQRPNLDDLDLEIR